MNTLTNGVRLAHATVDRPADRLTFLLPSRSEDEARAPHRHWWGRLERGDRIAVIGGDAPVELLDEAFRPLAHDLDRRPVSMERAGVVHLRLEGDGPVELRVTRERARSLGDGAEARGGLDVLVGRRLERLLGTALARCLPRAWDGPMAQ